MYYYNTYMYMYTVYRNVFLDHFFSVSAVLNVFCWCKFQKFEIMHCVACYMLQWFVHAICLATLRHCRCETSCIKNGTTRGNFSCTATVFRVVRYRK